MCSREDLGVEGLSIGVVDVRVLVTGGIVNAFTAVIVVKWDGVDDDTMSSSNIARAETLVVVSRR